MAEKRGPFENFVDSPYYSKWKLLWRCDNHFFFEVPPLASNALLTTFHPLLEKVNGM
jgi:hypothetical protein